MDAQDRRIVRNVLLMCIPHYVLGVLFIVRVVQTSG